MLELDLQENNFIEFLAIQHVELTNDDLVELEAQKKDEERKKEEEENIGDTGNGKGILFA